MIIKGGSRAGASSLAAHLLRTDTNENITLLEAVIPGNDTAAAVHKSLAYFEYMTKLTNGTKGLYHANIDPDGRYDMSEEEWTRAVDILEERLNLDAQPRLVLMHEKNGRQHVHVVWQRTDAEHGVLISDSMNYPKHELAARQMEREFGHALVKGVFTGRDRDEDRPIAKANHAEWQQGERTGVKPQDRQEEIAALWQQSDSGQAFVSALHEAGYDLARGDKKPIHMLVKDGELYDLRRSLDGVKKKDIEARLADYPAEHLPLAAEVKARQSEREARQEVREEPRQQEDQKQPDRSQDQAETIDRDAYNQQWQENVDQAGIEHDQRGRQGKIEEFANRLKASTQSRQHDQLIELDRRHGRQSAIKEEELQRYYGERRQAIERQIEAIKTRLERGGFWYRLRGKVREDREALPALQMSAQDSRQRETEARATYQREQAREREHLASAHERERQANERRIAHAFETGRYYDPEQRRQPERRHDPPQRGRTRDDGEGRFRFEP